MWRRTAPLNPRVVGEMSVTREHAVALLRETREPRHGR